MITRCYLEITNVCNLDCLFCPKTKRAKRTLTPVEFDFLTDRLRGRVKFLYFHLMGEPLLHAHLPEFIIKAREKGFVPVLTTNGTLLHKAGQLINALPHKVQISLHAHEGNGFNNLEQYVSGVMQFAQKSASHGIIIVLRLWNRGGYDSANERLLNLLAQYIPRPWTERYDGWRLAENIYLEFDNMFEWPDSEREEYGVDESFCYALRNQIGVLADGTVVPCCLDHDGDIPIGNLFEQPLDEILASSRARAMHDGFTRHEAVEPLCRRCGYAAVTKRFRK
ncbi:MAG: SPASM domain-containing protein [Bacteroidaceae bacterium]|nr:SPASM domain-containing protein [Bacteroidaceae bacterium]